MFVVPPFFGHISPTLSVGASLIARGHAVAWAGIQELPAAHIPAGGRFIVPHEELSVLQPEIQRILKRQDDGPNISGAEALKLALEETYIPFCRFMMKGLSRIVDEYRPDVIIHDCITFAGAICAYNKGIPYVTTTPVPPYLAAETLKRPKIAEWQGRHILGLQKEFGIDKEDIMVRSHEMNLVFTSQEFAGDTDPPAPMKFVGPVKGRPNDTPFDWEQLDKTAAPKVFVTLGTLLVDIRKDFFGKLVEAFGGQPVTIIAATDPAIFDTWPDNFIVQAYVPQSRLMEKVDAVICHGGFNTVNDTFSAGLPMLILPIAYDQFHTASLVENAGCGIRIRYKRLGVNALREALWELLENQKYRIASERIRETFINAGGNETAANLLEEFAHEHEEKAVIR